MKMFRIVLGCILAAFGFLIGSADAQVITEFSAGISTGAGLSNITAGPDGNLWFTESGIDRIGRITPDGVVTEFSAGITPGANPQDITAGADGNLWFTEYGDVLVAGTGRIGRITPLGVVTEFNAGLSANAHPTRITAGNDGNLWFLEPGGTGIGRITPSGIITELSGGLRAGEHLIGITGGPDGNVWVTESSGFGSPYSNRIERITPLDAITSFGPGGIFPADIAAGPDGNLWFSIWRTGSYRFARMTPDGVVTILSGITGCGSNFNRPARMTAGLDGNVWFTESSCNRIGWVTPLGVVTEFTAGPNGDARQGDITTGPDGNVWFTEPGVNRIGRITIPAVGAPPYLIGAVSRKTHGAAGVFDLALSSVVTNPTTEPRLGPTHTLVISFDKPLTAATVTVTEGIGAASVSSFIANNVVVDLSGVTDQQYVTISLTNVAASDGGTGGSASVRIGFLAGDVNQNRVVSVADLGLVKAQLAQPVTMANYLKDVNASGTLTVADSGITNANLTKALPAP